MIFRVERIGQHMLDRNVLVRDFGFTVLCRRLQLPVQSLAIAEVFVEPRRATVLARTAAAVTTALMQTSV